MPTSTRGLMWASAPTKQFESVLKNVNIMVIIQNKKAYTYNVYAFLF